MSDKKSGYGTPPQHSRFKKGQSGNPKGRPKGSLNFITRVQKALREKVVVTENGTKKTITKLEATAKQFANRLAAGDMNALKTLTTLTKPVEEENAPIQPLQMQEADEKVMQSILKRFARIPEEKK
jgi:hypothetical protein